MTIEHNLITGTDAIHPTDFYQSSDPGAVGANKSWLDTTTSPPIRKRRNSADTGWDTTLDPSLYQLKSLITTLGDTVYGTGASAWSRLAGNTTATKKFLRQTGDGAASAAPAWDTLVAGDIPSLDAAKVTTGTFDAALIPNLSANKIVSGVLGVARIPGVEQTYYAAHINAGGGLDIWYPLGANNNNTSSTAVVTANRLYAVPFVGPGRGATLDRLGINVTVAVAGNARFGIYDATSDTNIYPNALIVDGGAVSTSTTGAKSVTISQALTPGKLYWVVYLGDAAPTVRVLTGGSGSAICGIDSSFPSGSNKGLFVAQTYGSLPGTFPVSASTENGTAVPLVYGRFSA